MTPDRPVRDPHTKPCRFHTPTCAFLHATCAEPVPPIQSFIVFLCDSRVLNIYLGRAFNV